LAHCWTQHCRLLLLLLGWVVQVPVQQPCLLLLGLVVQPGLVVQQRQQLVKEEQWVVLAMGQW
jgi:hypothetical protein